MSLITPASFAYGRISTWNSSSITKLCNLVEALTPEELLELGAKEVCTNILNVLLDSVDAE